MLDSKRVCLILEVYSSQSYDKGLQVIILIYVLVLYTKLDFLSSSNWMFAVTS